MIGSHGRTEQLLMICNTCTQGLRLHNNTIATPTYRACNFAPGTGMAPSRLTWRDFYLLLQKPGKGTIIDGNEQLSLNG